MAVVSNATALGVLDQHVRDIVLLIDPETGRILDANRAAEQAYQYSRAELLERTIFDLRVAALASIHQQMKLADQDGILFEGVHRRRDGTEFPVEVSSRGETIGARRLLLSIIRDITERKRHDLERERLLHSLQQALAAREDFLWVASHELRTPITIVSLQLQQLRRLIDRGEPVERLANAACGALAQVDRLNTLVQSLFDASQIANGRLSLDRAPGVDLSCVVRDVVDRLAPQATQVGCQLVVETAPVVGCWDRTRLEQVLGNVLGNAIKYGAGRPIRIATRGEGEMAHLDVTDEGIGVAAGDSGRIFDKFERAVPSAHYGGLGLGLYISRQIVEAHGGWIDVDSSPGAGSTFRIALPR
jgi:PAS domain S-box-containing protein